MSIVFFFWPENVVWVTIFQEHLILHLSIKPDKPYTTMMSWHYTSPQSGSRRLIIPTAATVSPQIGQSDSNQLFQVMITTLNQRLRSFCVESRAKIGTSKDKMFIFHPL